MKTMGDGLHLTLLSASSTRNGGGHPALNGPAVCKSVPDGTLRSADLLRTTAREPMVRPLEDEAMGMILTSPFHLASCPGERYRFNGNRNRFLRPGAVLVIILTEAADG